MVSEDEEPLDAALFREPEGYYEPPKPPTYAKHTLSSGEVLKLRLVGHNPLWVKDDTPSAVEARQAKLCQRDTCYGTPDGWYPNISRNARIA